MSQPPDPDYGFGEVLPEQTADDIADATEQDDPESDADVRRLLDDKPPHHLD